MFWRGTEGRDMRWRRGDNKNHSVLLWSPGSLLPRFSIQHGAVRGVKPSLNSRKGVGPNTRHRIGSGRFLVHDQTFKCHYSRSPASGFQRLKPLLANETLVPYILAILYLELWFIIILYW